MLATELTQIMIVMAKVVLGAVLVVGLGALWYVLLEACCNESEGQSPQIDHPPIPHWEIGKRIGEGKALKEADLDELRPYRPDTYRPVSLKQLGELVRAPYTLDD